MPSAGSAPTPAGLAAANMLMQTGNGDRYAGIMDAPGITTIPNPVLRAAATKLEQLPAMVQGVLGKDAQVQVPLIIEY